MATSPIYNWPEPDNTDLVKNGALAIRTLGNAIDTTMATMVPKTIIDAKGDIIAGTAADTAARLAVGTNGQVLKANSATATGLEWAADSAGMTNPMTTTGDTIYSSSGSTPARLGIGSTGQVLTVAGGIPSWATPSSGTSGKILQIVQATTSTRVDISSTSYTDSGLTATITPTSNTSQILVLVTQPFYTFNAAIYSQMKWTLLRGSSTIWNSPTDATYGVYAPPATQMEVETIGSVSYLDSPASTSSLTYKTQGALMITTGSGQLSFQKVSNTAVMILMEIGA
jgi:hypothetical protein